MNSRIHVVEEFNRNVYDIIIASDEKEVLGNREKAAEEKAEDDIKEKQDVESDNEKVSSPGKKKRKDSRKDKEYGVSRGERPPVQSLCRVSCD